MLWHCWLGTRKSIQPVKIEWWDEMLSGARRKWFEYGPADATATPSSVASLKSSLVFNFLVLAYAYPGYHENEATKRVSIYLGRVYMTQEQPLITPNIPKLDVTRPVHSARSSSHSFHWHHGFLSATEPTTISFLLGMGLTCDCSISIRWNKRPASLRHTTNSWQLHPHSLS